MKEKTIAKHTPGPWTYEVTNGSNLAVMAGDEYVVSGCGCCGSPNCEEADARLIAAAPELLEAAQRVLSNKRGEDDWLILAVHCQDLATAIAKATGSTGT